MHLFYCLQTIIRFHCGKFLNENSRSFEVKREFYNIAAFSPFGTAQTTKNFATLYPKVFISERRSPSRCSERQDRQKSVAVFTNTK